eukprot:Gregarina_sp_Poly_1__6548@NODE_350_length_9319_cov_183_335387_g293_i0_p9_GENE_NODE_350_length_9319_cov_183_335387_g293_i0NODE_350_length_9319_cov_183_335387_g293_i0_p9_ORF_typecomplete_len143_score4_01DUF4516/PF14990_6/26DUF4516/PF14990_6/92DUF4516/PF14990_6/3_7e02_NODE_350_length_9319_cov_183_335387_g293_i09611389
MPPDTRNRHALPPPAGLSARQYTAVATTQAPVAEPIPRSRGSDPVSPRQRRRPERQRRSWASHTTYCGGRRRLSEAALSGSSMCGPAGVSWQACLGRRPLCTATSRHRMCATSSTLSIVAQSIGSPLFGARAGRSRIRRSLA